jgi:hypothetical protein
VHQQPATAAGNIGFELFGKHREMHAVSVPQKQQLRMIDLVAIGNGAVGGTLGLLLHILERSSDAMLHG